jgi:rod shape-determining protein MreB
VFVAGRGIVVDEPTVAAVDMARNRLVAFGNEAVALRGRCAGDVAIVRPVSHGQLADIDITAAVARNLLRVARTSSVGQVNVLCCASGAATSVQRRALDQVFKQAGTDSVHFVEQQLAVALGAGLAVGEPVASMVVDVGGGTTEIGILALGGLVAGQCVPIGGGDFDEAIRRFCIREYDLVIDLETAEAVKCAIASAWVTRDDKAEVRGRDASSGVARSAVISRSEVADALTPCLSQILGAAASCIASSPPDLANDLLNRGLYLAGGGALLQGFAQRLASATGVPVHLVEDPERCAIAGASLCLATMGHTTEAASGLAW